MRLLAGFLVAVAALAASSLTATAATARAPSEVSGLAHVIDGDTLHLTVPGTDKPVKIRLQGVAARFQCGAVRRMDALWHSQRTAYGRGDLWNEVQLLAAFRVLPNEQQLIAVKLIEALKQNQ